MVIVGAHDTLYIQAAASYMVETLPSASKVVIPDAAHLPNLDHPSQFQQAVTSFLEQLLRCEWMEPLGSQQLGGAGPPAWRRVMATLPATVVGSP